MKFILAATRWLISAMVSLHLTGLKSLVASSAKKVAKAASLVDAAVTVREQAAAVLAEARNTIVVVKSEAKQVAAAHGITLAAAVAEADSLRTEHTVGA